MCGHIYSHVMAHLQTNNLLSVNQHGFRSGFSCETQLILTVHDLLESFEHKHRVDIGVLDFSKAFDTVPHPRLLKKLELLGIRGDLYHWLTYFLAERDQRVVMEGSYSNFLHVIRGFLMERSWDLFSSYATAMIFLSALIVTLDYLLMIV